MQYFGFDRPSFGIKTYGFGSSEFSPLGLFAGGKQGVWYDPSDKSTMFQVDNNALGLVPVTTDGDPVGFILDKSQGLGLGEELVTGFSYNDSYWFKQGDDYITEGLNTSQTDFTIKHNIPSDKIVKFEVDIEIPEGASVPMYVYSSYTANLKNGKNIFYRYDKSGDGFLLIRSFGGHKLTIKNVSIKEVKGNHATQTVSAARPVYKTDGILHWLAFDGADDHIVINYPLSKYELWLGIGLTNTSAGYLFDMREASSGYYFGVVGLSDNKSTSVGYLTPTAFADIAKVVGLNLNFTSSKMFFMTRFNLANNASGKLFSYIQVAGSLTSDTRLNISDYLAQKSGVTL